MTYLDRAAILGVNDLPTRDVDVPEWGGTVRVRAMNAKDRDDYELAVMEAANAGRSLPENFRSIFAAACIVNEAGEQQFTHEDVTLLGQKSHAALGRIFTVVADMNALKPGAFEDMAKNLSAGPAGDSTSSSPSRSARRSAKSKHSRPPKYSNGARTTSSSRSAKTAPTTEPG